MSTISSIVAALAKIRHEIKFGGTESPCPLCGMPRCLRSDYIRCARCGVNWIKGIDDEWLDKDPRNGRLQRFLAEDKALRKAKESTNEKAGTAAH